MRGWFRQPKRHSEAAKLGWRGRWRRRKAAKLMRHAQAVARKKETLQSMLNAIEREFGDLLRLSKPSLTDEELAQRLLEAGFKVGKPIPGGRRTLTHTMELRWNKKKKRWEVIEVIGRHRFYLKDGLKDVFYVPKE